MRRILVLRGGALGDFIVTLPALAAVRRAWPSARIELAGNSTAAALGRDERLLDAVHSQHEARWSSLYGSGTLPAEFGAWLASFDLVVNFWPDEDHVLSRRFPLRADQKFVSAQAQPAIAPAAAHFCAALAPLGLTAAETFFSFTTSRTPILPHPRRIALHPGSGSAKKNWPLDRWTQLGEGLRRDHGADLLIVTGEAESAAAQSLARFGSAAHALPLPKLAARLAECRLFVGHDSGVSHLAAACGTPCVLLFGPTAPAMWAPPAPHAHVIWRGPTLDSISVGDVQREIDRLLSAQK